MGCGFPVAGARVVGAVGRWWGSSNAGSAGRRSRVRVGTRCSPCRPCSMGGPVARGFRGQALSLLRLPSSGGLPGTAAHVLWARVCGCGGPTLSPWPACPVGAGCCGGGGGPSTGPTAWCPCEPPLRTVGAAEGRSRGGVPSAVVGSV